MLVQECIGFSSPCPLVHSGNLQHPLNFYNNENKKQYLWFQDHSQLLILCAVNLLFHTLSLLWSLSKTSSFRLTVRVALPVILQQSQSALNQYHPNNLFSFGHSAAVETACTQPACAASDFMKIIFFDIIMLICQIQLTLMTNLLVLQHLWETPGERVLCWILIDFPFSFFVNEFSFYRFPKVCWRRLKQQRSVLKREA